MRNVFVGCQKHETNAMIVSEFKKVIVASETGVGREYLSSTVAGLALIDVSLYCANIVVTHNVSKTIKASSFIDKGYLKLLSNNLGVSNRVAHNFEALAMWRHSLLVQPEPMLNKFLQSLAASQLQENQ